MKTYCMSIAALVWSVLLVGNASAATPSWCAAGKPVKIAAVTWESGQFFGELSALILRNAYNCKTEFVTGSTAVTEAALVSQDLQLWPEQWDRTEIIKKGVIAKRIELVGNTLEGGTMEGWFVPEYVVKGDPERKIPAIAPDLKTVWDLAKYKSIFADDENPAKGRFLNCPTGWDCEMINNQKMKAYKLTEDYVNFRPGTGGALDATIASAFARGKPLLFYYWSPASLMGKYKMFRLEEPAYNEACWKTLGGKTTTNNVCPSATPPYRLQIGVSAGFKNDAPEVVDMLSKIQLTPQMLNQVLAQMSAKKLGGNVMAKDFVKNNAQLVNSWMTPEAAANFNLNFK
ncbi:glycine betaine ABC transporter substrate-binding protein [Polynucleobacter sp.]|uniref:glycine betaine ABC transporter substrate-binding protein n=1 Tax=Polynucleobacter sp. TaxID=2029855 RepID=UPI0037CCC0FC